MMPFVRLPVVGWLLFLQVERSPLRQGFDLAASNRFKRWLMRKVSESLVCFRF